MPMLFKLFHKIENNLILGSQYCPVTKAREGQSHSYRSTSLMTTDAKVLNKILGNRTQEYTE